MSIEEELSDKVRAGGVRVEARLQLLRELQAEGGSEQVARRIAELDRRIRKAASRVREDLA